MSEYRTYILDEKDLGLWDDYINRSKGGTIFHRLEWLKVAAELSKMQFIPVAVNKGNNIVCLFPLFLKERYGLKILLSPPHGCYISYLGPVFNILASNRYKYEWTYISIIDEIIRAAEKKIGFDYFRMIHSPAIQDMRPYIWKNYNIQPKYTYIFDLATKSEELYNNFHSTTKNAIKKALMNEEIVISRGVNYAQDILTLVRQRYAAQKKKFKVSNHYIEKLMGGSLSGHIESIAIIHNDQIVAGDITLTDTKHAYAWIGSVSRESNCSGVGELLLWEKIKEFTYRGYRTYDMIDANFRHLCRHKSKYGANLVTFFDVYKTSIKGKIALGLMNHYKRREDV